MIEKSCPISLERVDEHIARITALNVGILFTLFIYTQFDFIIYFLVLDFAVRLFIKKEYSLLFMLSKLTRDTLKLEPSLVDMAPKRLATFFGLSFLSAIALFHALSLVLMFYIFSGVLLACIFLEVAFSYCLGCEIYYIYKRLFS